MTTKTIKKSIKQQLFGLFQNVTFTLKDAYMAIPDMDDTSIRARIYENLNVSFERVSRGVYKVLDNQAILIEGNGRELDFIKDSSLDLILTDHPWSDVKSNKGGNRNFASYPVFEYEQKDFDEKYRVLKDNTFLVEIIPAENENNFEYLYNLKKLALNAGFSYYAKVDWIKGNFVSNTGRKSKNTEEILIFTKGKAPALRLNPKKMKQMNDGKQYFMSGTKKMLPTAFNVSPPSKKDIVQSSQKPVELLELILDYLTHEGAIVLDQFAGSGSLGIAASKTNRKSISIELLKESCNNIKEKFKSLGLPLLFFA